MSEWFSVKDGLPDLNGKYLVTIEYTDRRVVQIVSFETSSGWYKYDSEYGEIRVDNVIAWQSLPNPYKGE